MSRVDFSLLFITDGFDAHTAATMQAALSAIPPGQAAVQLRAKQGSSRSLYDAAERLREVTTSAGAQLFVNDRVDVALVTRADGVHLPVAGLSVAAVRRLGGDQLGIGCSTHTLHEVEAANQAGADFLTFGPVYETPSKVRFGPPRGLDELAAAVQVSGVPVFALGGVTEARARACLARSARIACIGAICHAADPALAARGLWEAIRTGA